MRVAQISLVAKVYGNLNADAVIGQRVTLKRMHSSEGETYPFISARAVKYSIREALRERGHKIDPFELKGTRVVDSGDPREFTDNDLFGFMRAPKGEKEVASRRQAPIAISYFKAIRDTPIVTEMGLRTPRVEGKSPEKVEKESRSLLPFEVEVAEFVGRLNCIIYDYIGKYQGTEKSDGDTVTKGQEFVDKDERIRRLKDFLEIFLTPSYVLPRRTNSLNIPEHIAALVALSDGCVVPVFQYLDYVQSDAGTLVDVKKLKLLANRKEIEKAEKFLIDYQSAVPQDAPITSMRLPEAISRIVTFLTKE
jgi:CRISPR-associated protein Cas7/Cst2/DevR subtype I-B